MNTWIRDRSYESAKIIVVWEHYNYYAINIVV